MWAEAGEGAAKEQQRRRRRCQELRQFSVKVARLICFILCKLSPMHQLKFCRDRIAFRRSLRRGFLDLCARSWIFRDTTD